MERKLFKYKNDKSGLYHALIREANIALSKINDGVKYSAKYRLFKNCIDVAKAIDDSNPESEDDVDTILDTIKRLWEIGLLSPLTFSNDEWEKVNEATGIKYNTRCHSIYMKNTKIYNSNAYNLKIEHLYDNELGREVYYTGQINTSLYHTHKIYFTKGGVVTGDYFDECAIKKCYIDAKSYYPELPIVLPVSVIRNAADIYYIIPQKNPFLKYIANMYDVDLKFDQNLFHRFDIRKYKKLEIK